MNNISDEIEDIIDQAAIDLAVLEASSRTRPEKLLSYIEAG